MRDLPCLVKALQQGLPGRGLLFGRRDDPHDLDQDANDHVHHLGMSWDFLRIYLGKL
jgi:hypothetical protein